MSNVEHPKHYQLSINLEALDVIRIVTSKSRLTNYDSFLVGNVIKYLFRAEQKNGLEDYKKAFYYIDLISVCDFEKNYNQTEAIILNKIINTFEDDKLRRIIELVISLDFSMAESLLQDYIEEQEKRNAKED